MELSKSVRFKLLVMEVLFRNTAGCLSCLALGFILLSGCGRPEPQMSYEVVKPRRMLVATLLDQETNTAWFIKLDGPTTVVDRQEKAFAQLVDSLKFSASSDNVAGVTWDMPEGWSDAEAGPVQFAALAVDDSANPIKATVTKLGIRSNEEVDPYLLNNLNRWRRQISLPPLEQLDQEQIEEKEVDGKTAYVISLYGRDPDGAEENALGAARPSRPPVGGSTSPGLNVELPEGWTQGRSTGVSVVSLVVKDGDQTGAITVTPLNVSPWDANVQRWIGQLGAEPMTGEQITKATEKIDVGGAEADMIDLVSGPSVDPKKRLVGIRAIRGKTAWFIKFDGPPELVEKELDKFKNFIMKLPLPE